MKIEQAESSGVGFRKCRWGARVPLTAAFYFTRIFSILLFLSAVLSPILKKWPVSEHLKVSGSKWGGPIFEILFGLILYGVSWLLKDLRATFK